MDTITLARIIGLAVLSIIFVVTVILMPRIFGVNAPSPSAEGPVEGRTRERSIPVRPVATAPAAERAVKG